MQGRLAGNVVHAGRRAQKSCVVCVCAPGRSNQDVGHYGRGPTGGHACRVEGHGEVVAGFRGPREEEYVAALQWGPRRQTETWQLQMRQSVEACFGMDRWWHEGNGEGGGRGVDTGVGMWRGYGTGRVVWHRGQEQG